MDSRTYLEKLVAFPTYSSQPNKPLIDWVEASLRALNAQTTPLEAPGGKATLWARLGPEGPGGIVLAGHTDVVPTEGQTWTDSPLQLTEKDGKLYGRGSCDMKGFLAAALALAEKLKGHALRKPLYLALTHDEETTMDGAKQLVAWLKQQAIDPDWIWLGEPTNMQVATAHKGIASIKTSLKGIAAHSSLPDKGLNANILAADIIAWIRQESEAYKAKPYEGSLFSPPYTTFNVGLVQGGRAINIISDYCDLSWEFRLHPGDSVKAIWTSYEIMLEEKIYPQLNRFEGTDIKTSIEVNNPPFLCEKENPGEPLLLTAAGYEKATAIPFATEACFLQDIGAPLLICGPGSVAQAHQPDEFVSLDQLALCDRCLWEAAQTLL